MDTLFYRLFADAETASKTIATTFFIALLVAEMIISYKKSLQLFRTKDTVINMTLGIMTSVTKVGVKATTLLYFTWLQEHWRLFEIPANSILGLIALFMLNDLIFYIYHRLSHESRIFWAMHVAHHSSTSLNTSTAIRGNFMHFFYRFVFWSPLAILGFDPILIVLIDEISFYYQIYIHTEIFKKMPRWFEWVFNTPSHHRVHHASNPEYLDKNYGAVFIIWDRLFGSFREEDKKPVYGLTKNPPKQNIPSVLTHELKAIWQDIKEAHSPQEVWQYIFGKPGWHPTSDTAHTKKQVA